MRNYLHLALLSFCVLSLTVDLRAQRKDILMAQPDGRFTVFAQRYWSSLAGSESYFFYVQNNTDEEYTIKIEITLHLACDGWKKFQLGYGGIRLKPKQMTSASQGGEYSVLGGNTEGKKACRMKDKEGEPTFLHSATYHLYDIVNVTSENAANAKRLEDEKRRQDEERRKREDQQKEDDRRRQEQADKLKKEAEDKRKSDEFWGTKRQNAQTVGTEPDVSTLPELFRTTDGRYFKKEGGKLQQIEYDGYMALKLERTKKLNESEQGKKLSPEEQKRIVDQVVEKNNAVFDSYFKSIEDANRKYLLDVQAINAANEIKETKQALNENSNLSGNYQSVDQLMAEFNQKMANVSRMTADLTTQRNTQLNSAVDARFNQPGYEASIGAGMKLIGGIIHNAKAAKEKKEAQEQLRLQQQIQLNKIAAEERKLLTGIRTDLFSKFKEAKFPTSTSKIEHPTLYFFAYAYDPAKIGAKQSQLFVSNVFAVSKYSDGTWPFRNSIVTELNKLTPYAEVMHGYYANEGEAEQMRQGMIDIFLKTGGTTTPFVYKGKKAASTTTGAAGKTDFWETGKKTTKDSTTNKPKGKDDFWNN